jgi:threonylcarbamoyladenosine tRNA methylthiotransferase MtaB
LKYSVITFGCRVNQADSLGFEEEFLGAGAQPAAPEDSDVVVVNTCSVTASADQAARQTIRRVARLNPNAKIVVTGCYATRRPDEVASLPNVLRVVPNDDKSQLVSMARGVRLQPDLSTAERFGDGEGSCGASIQPGMAGRTAFTLRVQTGCAEPCSYCIIPTTRGAPISVALERVLQDVDRVRAAGFKEIALTGVHLGSYGRDLMPRSSLIELLRALDATLGRPEGRPLHLKDDTYPDFGRGRPLGRPDDPSVLFRISSLEPMDCTPEIVDLVATSERFAPHFHLPLQHASNRVLAAMRRPYTIEFYSDLVERIRTLMPHASIGSDLIVGFPGETDQDFECLAAYLETSPLTHLHVFPYSDRPSTPAAEMPNKIHGSIVRERANRLRSISQQLSGRFRRSQVGVVHRALTLDDGSVAVTGNYLKVRIPPGRARNEWIDVRLVSEQDGELLGR